MFTGTLYIILQISATDLVSTWIAIAEISYFQNNSWNFGAILCPLFFGSEIVINTVSLYLHVLLNFHTISSWNIQKKIEENNKNPLTQDIDNSTECLVSESENNIPNRTIHIDYRYKKSTLSIIIPSILIWFCCLSLSIPEFSLSTIVENYNNHTLCTMVDLNNGQMIRYLLILFRNVIPIPLLLLTFIVILVIICNNSLNIVKKSSLKKYEELNNLMHLSIRLTLLYIILSVQRNLFYFLHNIYPHRDSLEDNFKFAPLESLILSSKTSLLLCMGHYFVVVLRPILCILSLPFIVNNIKEKFFKTKKDDK